MFKYVEHKESLREIMVEVSGMGQKGLKVLIVEDDSESATLLEVLFKRKGFNVIDIATNGDDAFEKYKKNRPDVVTMDIMMPRVDGRVCTKNILEFDPEANIIVVSVLDPEELETLKSLGVKAFIKKPLDIQELFAALINISFSIVKDDEGVELGAVGMASTVEEDSESSRLFIGVLRHDILNPLGLIKNFAELLSDSAKGDQKSPLDAIIRNTERLIGIIDDASKLLEIKNLKRLDFEHLEMSGLLNDVINIHAKDIESKEIHLENKVRSEIFVNGNIILKEVFSQLLSNAIKYSPKGGRIVINADSSDKHSIVSFKDSGSGVDNEYKEMIFRRFDQSKKEGVKGSGIGLAIVKKIIDLHEGRVWAEDNPEGGSVFKVEISNKESGE
jgi:signal transduction histidine kinase